MTTPPEPRDLPEELTLAMSVFWTIVDTAANCADPDADGEALDHLPVWLNQAMSRGLDAAVEAVAARVRARVAEEIFAESQRLRAEDWRAGKVGIEYVNGFEDAAGLIEQSGVPAAGPTDQPQDRTEEKPMIPHSSVATLLAKHGEDADGRVKARAALEAELVAAARQEAKFSGRSYSCGYGNHSGMHEGYRVGCKNSGRECICECHDPVGEAG